MREIRPRQYAAQFMQLQTDEEKAAFAKKIPKHLQALVKEHIVTTRAMQAEKWKRWKIAQEDDAPADV